MQVMVTYSINAKLYFSLGICVHDLDLSAVT